MRYVVTGRAHPERADIHIAEFELPISETEWIRARCESSQLAITLNIAGVDGTTSAFVTAEHHAQTVVSALGFALGCGYSVEMIQVVDENGHATVFGVAPHELKFNDFREVFSRALRLAFLDLHFRLALRDYVSAITESLDCATYCYRAIEAIKSAFAFHSGHDRWDEMHAALGTDRNTIILKVKRYADPVRHGNWIALRETSLAERESMLTLTRDILLRYLQYAQ